VQQDLPHHLPSPGTMSIPRCGARIILSGYQAGASAACSARARETIVSERMGRRRRRFLSSSSTSGPHARIHTLVPKERFALNLFDRLWDRYRERVEHVRVYEAMVNEKVRSFPPFHEPSNCTYSSRQSRGRCSPSPQGSLKPVRLILGACACEQPSSARDTTACAEASQTESGGRAEGDILQ